MTSEISESDDRNRWAPADELLKLYVRKFAAVDLPEHVRKSFAWYFRKLCADETGIRSWTT